MSIECNHFRIINIYIQIFVIYLPGQFDGLKCLKTFNEIGFNSWKLWTWRDLQNMKGIIIRIKCHFITKFSIFRSPICDWLLIGP